MPSQAHQDLLIAGKLPAPAGGPPGSHNPSRKERLPDVETLRCARCQDIIGVYEPIVVRLADGSTYIGGRRELTPQLAEAGSEALHEDCDQPEQPE